MLGGDTLHAGDVDVTSKSNDLQQALQENLKLRRELATEVAEAKGDKLAAVRFRLASVLGAINYALFRRVKAASLPPASSPIVGRPDPDKTLMKSEAARKQYTHQRQQLGRQTDPGECRQRALECVRVAQMTKDREAQQTWSDLAKTWLIFATDLEASEGLLDEWGKPKSRRKGDPLSAPNRLARTIEVQ
jgi:hypothetical protein